MSASESDYFENPENVATIERFQLYLDRLPGVDKTISLADYLKLVNYTTNGFDSRYYALPQEGYELRMLMNNFKIILGNDLLKRFLSAGYDRANILMLTHIASSRAFHDTQQQIRDHAENAFTDDLTVDVTGLGIVIAASSHLLTLGQIKSLAISLVLILTVMVLLFLSGKVGLIAVVPNLFPIVVNFGLMGFLDIPLSVATSLIASVAIGLAVDDTIHYLVRYNTEFKRDPEQGSGHARHPHECGKAHRIYLGDHQYGIFGADLLPFSTHCHLRFSHGSHHGIGPSRRFNAFADPDDARGIGNGMGSFENDALTRRYFTGHGP